LTPPVNLLAMPNDSITAGMPNDVLTNWLTMRNRARVDDEILLARGVISVIVVIPVSRKDHNSSFKPWVETGEKLQSQLSLS
jgi:hypothetical protein